MCRKLWLKQSREKYAITVEQTSASAVMSGMEEETVELCCKFCGGPLTEEKERATEGFKFYRCEFCQLSTVLPRPLTRNA
jgi:hypothetical protein